MCTLFYSTNNKEHKTSFESALLCGMAPDYGLYMISQKDIPRLTDEQIMSMKGKEYSQIAFEVLNPYLKEEIPEEQLKDLLNDAYSIEKIPTKVELVTKRTYIMWLTQGPTYSFKDYAARFFGRTLNYFLGKRKIRRTVVVATSGDTGGAVADALHGLNNVDCVVFYPQGSISEGQRKQMTTLKGNIYAFEVNGDFDVCQALAKNLLGDKNFAENVFNDKDQLTSANSISVGRLLPQAVYPFYAYSQIKSEKMEPFIASVPSGNFGDMMGTMIAKRMGLPIEKVLCGVNENTEFTDFLKTGKYIVSASKKSPSSAMIVSHPSNLARLIDLYDGHMYDKRDENKKVVQEGIIDKEANLAKMQEEIWSTSVNNEQHYLTMKEVYDKYKVIIDPHGAVGWRTLEEYNKGDFETLAVIYETADPGKFPLDVKKAINITPPLPKGMQKQLTLDERIYSITKEPLHTEKGLKLSEEQLVEAKEKLKEIFK